jgi:hypothetical protein
MMNCHETTEIVIVHNQVLLTFMLESLFTTQRAKWDHRLNRNSSENLAQLFLVFCIMRRCERLKSAASRQIFIVE